MSTLDNSPLAPVRPADLYELFDHVAGGYAFAACAYLGRPNDAPMDGGLEFAVSLRGAGQGHLVLRASLGASRLLADGIRSEGHADDAESADALREVCNLLAGHLLTSRLEGARLAYEPFLPMRSDPENWPPRSPDAACALLLETEPVEIRYWHGAAS